MTAIVPMPDGRVFVNDALIYACIYWRPDGSAIISTRVCRKSEFGGCSAYQVAADLAVMFSTKLSNAFKTYCGYEKRITCDWDISLRLLPHDVSGRRSAYILVPWIAFMEAVEGGLPELLKSTIAGSFEQFKGVLFERF